MFCARGQCHEKVKKIESQYHDIDSHYQATRTKFDPIHSEVTERRMVKTQYMQQVQIYIDETQKQCDALIWATVTVASSLEDPTMDSFALLSTTSKASAEAEILKKTAIFAERASERRKSETGTI